MAPQATIPVLSLLLGVIQNVILLNSLPYIVIITFTLCPKGIESSFYFSSKQNEMLCLKCILEIPSFQNYIDLGSLVF